MHFQPFQPGISEHTTSNMAEEGVTKVKLHKQEPAGLVTSDTPDNSIAATEKKEDPDELGSEDFKEAADKAQVDVCAHFMTKALQN